MDPIIRKLKIQNLKAQLEACHLQNVAFAKEYEASSTAEEKEEIAGRWDKAIKEEHFVKRALEILEEDPNDLTTHR
jgi:hypothetical protein